MAEEPSYLAVLSGNPPRVVDVIFLGQDVRPSSIAYDPTNNTVFVGTETSNLIVVSAATRTVVAHVDIGFGASTLVFDPVTDAVYAGSCSDNASVNGTTYAEANYTKWLVGPYLMAYDPVTADLITLSCGGASGSVSLEAINPRNGSVAWDHESGIFSEFTAATVNQRNGQVVVAVSNATGGLIVVNGINGRILRQIPLDISWLQLSPVSYNPWSGNYLVGEEFSNSIQVINASTDQVLSPLGTGGEAAGIEVNGATGRSYIVNGDTATVAVLSANDSHVESLSNIGGGPNAVAIDDQNGEVYVASSDNVTVINASTHRVVGSIPVGFAPQGILYDPESQAVLVANTDNSTVSEISTRTNSVEATVPVNSTPIALALDFVTNQVYVACMGQVEGQSAVDVISGSPMRVIATISNTSWYRPDGIAYVPSSDEIFLDNGLGGNLVIISPATDKVVGSVSLPFASLSATTGQLVWDDVTGDLFVANSGYVASGPGTDFFVNPVQRSVVGDVRVGDDPYGIALGNSTADLFAASRANDTVSVVDTLTQNTTATISLPEGTNPEGLAFDPMSGELFVADWGTDSVSYFAPPGITPAYLATFTESNLLPGTNWSVTVHGYARSSTAPSIAFDLPNGTYPYSVGNLAGYFVYPVSGEISVSGPGAARLIEFFAEGPFPSQTAGGNGWLAGLVIGLAFAVVVAVIWEERRQPKP